jgi:hypothetical protein
MTETDADSAVAEAMANRADAEQRISAAFHAGAGRLQRWFREQPIEASLVDLVRDVPVVEHLGRPLLDAWQPALERSVGRGIWIGVPAEHVPADAVLVAPQKAVRPDVVRIARFHVREHGARLVTNVTATTRRAIVSIVEQGIRENHTIRTVRDRLVDIVGLNHRQARTLATYRQALVDAGTPAKRLERAVERRRADMIKARALLIARTETARAENEARREVWARLAVEGQLDHRLYRKWITYDPCPYCRALGRHRAVPLGEPYVSAKYGQIMGPPAHPACVCSEALVMRR